MLAMAGLGVACLANQSRGYALYPTADGRPDETEVAQLAGYVRPVDGKDVSASGKRFELLPGCHVIGTPSRWISSAGSGAVMWATGEWTFALPMKAGYQYAVEIIVPPLVTGPTALGDMKAFERDMHGTRTRTFARAQRGEDLQACREEAGNDGAAPGASLDP